jgi:carbon monoxide dehydrogenase subunit G
MFKVKASFTDSIEIGCSPDEAMAYFSDLRNFVELMPGIESIHTDLKGIAHWTIRAEIPVVGSLKERFSVVRESDTEDSIEWIPARAESRNFLRFAARFEKISDESTVVEFAQGVELRREKARDLHPLAGMVGESLISREMNRRVAEMIRDFIDSAKSRLEGPNK